MHPKLIASDFDGTIGRGEQLKKDAEAIARFRRDGNIFGLVSGRNAAALRYVQEKGGIEVDFLLSDSGGNCRLDGKTLFCYEGSALVLLPLCDYLMQRGTTLLSVNRPDGADMIYYRHSDGREDYTPRRALWSARAFTQVSSYFEEEERSLEIARELNALFPHLEALPNRGCLDIVPRGRGKAAGLRELSDRLDIPHAQIFTIGDSHNDLSMIEAFGGFFVSSAPKDLQVRAKMGVVESVEEMIARVMEL